MEWDYLYSLGLIGILMLALQLAIYAWARWWDRTWRGLTTPVSIGRVFLEWIVYMVLFLLCSLALRALWQLSCAQCGK